MARLRDCIEAGRATGQITEQMGIELEHRVDGFSRGVMVRGGLSPEAAARMAEKQALESKAAEIALRKRQQALQAIRLEQAIRNAQSHPDGFSTGVMALLVKDLGGRAGYSNIDNRAKAILGTFHARFAEALQSYRTKNLGFSQDQEGLRNLVRELFDGNTGDPDAKAFAKMWSDVAEEARQRFNRAGGAIPKREDWGLPQYHDPLRVEKVGKDAWKREIIPMLDRERMLNERGVPMSDIEFELMLDRAYDRIVTSGLVDMMPGRVGGSKLANRHQDHRVLAFKTADDWLAYHDKYGHADIYTTLTDHLASMAHDIAKLEILGPNPEAAFRHLRDMAHKEGLSGLRMRFLESVWEVVSGRSNAAESVKFADVMQSTRNLLVSARLGGAFLSSISDIGFNVLTSRLNGMPATKVLARQLKLFNPAAEADRLAGVKMGMTAEAWLTRSMAANRMSEVTGANFSARVADITMRASLLSPWTEAGRKAFGMEFAGFVAEHTGKTFDDLPKPLRDGLRRYGFTPAEWDMLRATKPLEHRGVRYISPEELMKRTDLDEARRTQLATKWLEMVLTEMDYAVPTPDARVRAITTAGLKRGTIMGELVRNTMMFKSFPITVITTHLYRGALMHGLKNKASYLAALGISTTILGGMALQAKDLSRGKDPRPMDTPQFWQAAFVQGGGAGIYGDFLFSDANRFGQGIAMTAAGPWFDAANDVYSLLGSNFWQAVNGEETRFAPEMLQFIGSYTPGNSLWYTRLALEREVLDQAQLWADPKAQQRFRRIMRHAQREYGQDYWWRPGTTAPQRAPDIESAGGN